VTRSTSRASACRRVHNPSPCQLYAGAAPVSSETQRVQRFIDYSRWSGRHLVSHKLHEAETTLSETSRIERESEPLAIPASPRRRPLPYVGTPARAAARVGAPTPSRSIRAARTREVRALDPHAQLQRLPAIIGARRKHDDAVNVGRRLALEVVHARRRAAPPAPAALVPPPRDGGGERPPLTLADGICELADEVLALAAARPSAGEPELCDGVL
jgi:hypothetical protein